MADQSIPPIEPMTREDIESVRELCSAIIAELQDIPHSTYVRANQYLGELRSMFEEKLPGGFAGICTDCEQAVGNAEPHETIFGEVTCGACLDEGADLPTVTIKREVEPA